MLTRSADKGRAGACQRSMRETTYAVSVLICRFILQNNYLAYNKDDDKNNDIYLRCLYGLIMLYLNDIV